MKHLRFFLNTRLYFGCLVFTGIGVYYLYAHVNRYLKIADTRPAYITAPVKAVSVTMVNTRMSDYIYLEGYDNPLKIEERHAKAYYKNRMVNELDKGDTVEVTLASHDAEKLGRSDEILTLYGLKNRKGTYLDDAETFKIDKSPGAEFYIGASALGIAVLLFLLGWFVFKLRP
ncbi:MAG TPA: hypothetical protein VEC12_07385 [Bacteroidia bacterium]|nr:hypothetical protein [Bacteroidia bacterium]